MSTYTPTNPDTRGAEATTAGWPIRVWPGVVIAVLTTFFFFVPGYFAPQSEFHFYGMMFAPPLGALAIVFWWLLGARARGWDRWIIPALYLLPAFLLCATLYKGMALAITFYALPFLMTLWVVWLAATIPVPREARRLGLIVVLVAGWTLVSLLRVDGMTGEFWPDLAWRWSETAEQKFARELNNRSKAEATATAFVIGPNDWAEFRGPNRDSRVTGVSIDPDWNAHPPKELWKQRVGPGWGTFSVVGDRIFTQEQRPDDQEAVVCFLAATGAQVWERLIPGRFSEPIAGAGPRATPTLHDGKLFAQTAKGKLLCLDAANGNLLWTKDLVEAVGGVVPEWGYSGSPLVHQGLVVVYAGGPDNKGVAAFKVENGDLVWAKGNATHSYCSVHRAKLAGVEQLLLTSDYGVEAFRPSDGTLLWEHNWLIKGMNRVTQPIILGDSDVVIGTGVGPQQGARRLHLTLTGDKWDVQTVWTTKAIKSYYNDGVVYKGHLYGFDAARFCCVDLATGQQKWKESGRYGNGQVLLLEDQGMLVLQNVDGSVALVEANPNEFVERASYAAIEGKTWNHPVVAQGKLFVRNGEWAACYQLTPAGK